MIHVQEWLPDSPKPGQQPSEMERAIEQRRDRTENIMNLSNGITVHQTSNDNVQLYGEASTKPMDMYAMSVDLIAKGKNGLLIHPKFPLPIGFFPDKPSHRITAPINIAIGTFSSKALNTASVLTKDSGESVHIRGIHGDSGSILEIISTNGQAEIRGKWSIHAA